MQKYKKWVTGEKSVCCLSKLLRGLWSHCDCPIVPRNCSMDIKSLKVSGWIMLGRGWVGLCFYLRPRRGGWQSHGRFTRRCSPLFKRMHKGVCLMIYYSVPLWKSKWILESAQLLNPDLEECDLWKWHWEPLCVPLCVLASMCETASWPH